MQIPDLTQRVVGFRQWYVDLDDFLIRPVGMSDSPPWLPGPQLAQCWATTTGGYRTACLPVVNDECHCGFYALHNLRDAEGYGGIDSDRAVQGIVTGWGRIAVHCDGFRAQYIEIMAIIMPPRIAKNTERALFYKSVADRYNVPLMAYDRAESYALEFGDKIPEHMRPGNPEGTTGEMVMFHDVKQSLRAMREVAAKAARDHELEDCDDDFPDIPQWIVDVAMELDPSCPEAMAGLYDIYVPNLGDTLLAIQDPPKPTYLRFPEEPIIPVELDMNNLRGYASGPTKGSDWQWSPLTMHLCTNGNVAYLPQNME